MIPPNFNLLPPEQLSEKNINSIESDLAKEILFGLEDNVSESNVELSTMENILNRTEASLLDDSIRVEIDENFASEKKIIQRIGKMKRRFVIQLLNLKSKESTIK